MPPKAMHMHSLGHTLPGHCLVTTSTAPPHGRQGAASCVHGQLVRGFASGPGLSLVGATQWPLSVVAGGQPSLRAGRGQVMARASEARLKSGGHESHTAAWPSPLEVSLAMYIAGGCARQVVAGQGHHDGPALGTAAPPRIDALPAPPTPGATLSTTTNRTRTPVEVSM